MLCMSMCVVGNWGRDGDEPVNTQNPQNRSDASNVHMFQTYDSLTVAVLGEKALMLEKVTPRNIQENNELPALYAKGALESEFCLNGAQKGWKTRHYGFKAEYHAAHSMLKDEGKHHKNNAMIS